MHLHDLLLASVVLVGGILGGLLAHLIFGRNRLPGAVRRTLSDMRASHGDLERGFRESKGRMRQLEQRLDMVEQQLRDLLARATGLRPSTLGNAVPREAVLDHADREDGSWQSESLSRASIAADTQSVVNSPQQARHELRNGPTVPGDQSSPDRHPVGSEEETFSRERAQTIFAHWCQTSERPRSTPLIDIVPVRYARLDAENELSKQIHLVRDAKQRGEFVRFSATGSQEGILYPDPDANFSPVVQYLFPDLGPNEHRQRDLLAHRGPVNVHRRPDNMWEVV